MTDSATKYPTKVQQVLDRIDRANQAMAGTDREWRQWVNVQVEVRQSEPPYEGSPYGAMYVIRAERLGNVFVAESLQLFVSTTYWPWSHRTTQRGVRGTIHRFGGDRKVASPRDLYVLDY